jgi:tRNA nucleotidyltransferase (CCA-adding enzyme)
MATQMEVIDARQIDITAEERQLFDLLLDSVKFHGKSSILRVAGGWVRDKLLQIDNHDIDIALDDQSGIEFAQNVNTYLSSVGMETRTIALIQVSVEIVE